MNEFGEANGRVETRIVWPSLAMLSPITAPTRPAARMTCDRMITVKTVTGTYDGSETMQQWYYMPRVVPDCIALNYPHHRQAQQTTPIFARLHEF
jgi:hypothetical protein